MGSKKNVYIKDHAYAGRRKKRLPSGPILFATVLVVVTLLIALHHYIPDLTHPKQTNATPSQTRTSQTTEESKITETTHSVATPTESATPTPTPIPKAWNSQLLPPADDPLLQTGPPASGLSPDEQKITGTILDDMMQKISSYQRPYPIALTDPLFYNQVPGVLTFRGNNYRNAPAFGLIDIEEKKLTQEWEKGTGSLQSSSWSFSWTGTGWTGQPLLVQWDESVRRIMNIIPEKKEKKDLIEVIYATMDGHVYFLDLDDGKPTRDPIHIGATIKGTPCVDPRGYPVLYVGQGDKNGDVTGMGFRVYNLIDQSLLYYRDCSLDPSYRTSWAACDSSPIFDAEADTLIFPNENGLIYTARMNTHFDVDRATLTINPEFTAYRYKMPGMTMQGIESSMAIYDHYGYFSDNSGIFHCVDLNTMEMVWSRQLEDDSDVTPVLCHEGDLLAVYTGTEVDWQKDIFGEYQGHAFVYKMNAMTGEVIWESSVPCYTRNEENQGNDINGGVLGTPVIGKKSLDGLVIFSFCMTKGVYSGNSVVAFDQTDGHMVWTYEMNHYSWSSPVDLYDENGNGYLIIPDSVGQLHLIDGTTGERLDVLQLTKGSQGESAGNIESSCAAFGNRLVVGTRGQVIVGFTIR